MIGGISALGFGDTALPITQRHVSANWKIRRANITARFQGCGLGIR
jgi:hypothetical protein